MALTPRFPEGFRSLLSYRSYRLYLASSTIGSFASTAQFLAQGWLVAAVGGGAVGVGLYLAVRLGVKSLLTIPSGLIADRMCRSSIYAWMRVASALSSLVAVAALVSPAPLAVALGATALAAAAHALDLPAHRALQAHVQPEQEMERGMSLGSSASNAASLFAPMVTFPLAAIAAPGPALLLSAALFLVAAAVAFGIPSHRAVRAVRSKASHDVSAAFRYVVGTPMVVLLLVATVLPAVVDKAVTVALPSAAGGDKPALGLVLAAPELGAITFALLLATLKWRTAPWITVASAACYTAAIVAASLGAYVVGLEMIALALFLAGGARAALTLSAVAGLHRRVPVELRGRLMTF